MSLWLSTFKACGHPKWVISKNHTRSTSEVVQAKFSNNVSNYNFVEDLISLGFDFGRLKLVGIQSKAEASNQDMSAAKVSIAFLNNKICIKITSAYRLNKNPL